MPSKLNLKKRKNIIIKIVIENIILIYFSMNFQTEVAIRTNLIEMLWAAVIFDFKIVN